MRKRHRFTLVEILTVIVIISILVGIALSVAKYARNKAQLDKTLAKMKGLEMGLDNCQHDLGFYPTTSDASHDIVQLGDHFDSTNYTPLTDASISSSWPFRTGKFRDSQTGRPYVEGYDGGDYMDAWGRPFLYRCDGNQHRKQTFDLFSAGPDGEPETEDDVTNWQRN